MRMKLVCSYDYFSNSLLQKRVNFFEVTPKSNECHCFLWILLAMYMERTDCVVTSDNACCCGVELRCCFWHIWLLWCMKILVLLMVYVTALDTNNIVVKKQVLELFSALCLYSEDGYNVAMVAFDYFKVWLLVG
jgi:hypothetical protein